MWPVNRSIFPNGYFFITYQVKYLIEILAFPNTLIKHLSVSEIPEMTLFTGRDGCFLCVSQTVSKTLEHVIDRLCSIIKDLPASVIHSITGRQWNVSMF